MDNTLKYTDASRLKFYSSDSNLLCLELDGEDIGRVSVLRMFPLQLEEEYLCIRCENYKREDREKEIGIIRSLSELTSQQADLVREELSKRYFVPEILSVDEVKEEFGQSMWKVNTSAGVREFTIADMSSNVRPMESGKVMLIDIYGNRYYIPDVKKIDDKTMKVLEIWL